MKSKIYLLWSLALVFMLSFNACKPKESAYKAAYDAAQAREVQNSQLDEVTPVSKPVISSTDDVQKEKVTVLDGAGIQQFSVVVGSFQTRTNAVSLRERMANQGYKSFLAQNESGMFRVIVATFNDKASAVAEKERVKAKYYPDFQDSWILDKQ